MLYSSNNILAFWPWSIPHIYYNADVFLRFTAHTKTSTVEYSTPKRFSRRQRWLVLHKGRCSIKISWEDPTSGGVRLRLKLVHYQVKHVTRLVFLLRQEDKVPLHSFKKAPRCLSSSSHVSLGFDEKLKPSTPRLPPKHMRVYWESRDRETMV